MSQMHTVSLEEPKMHTVSLESTPRVTASVSSKELSGSIPEQMPYIASKASMDTATIDPGAQSARDFVTFAAKSAASQGVAHAQTGFTEVRRYTQQNPDSVRALSFCIALALLIFSVLGAINVFDAVFKP